MAERPLEIIVGNNYLFFVAAARKLTSQGNFLPHGFPEIEGFFFRPDVLLLKKTSFQPLCLWSVKDFVTLRARPHEL